MNGIPMDEYKVAVREDVCGICQCYTPSKLPPEEICVHESSNGCPIFFKLQEIVDVISSLKSESIAPYAAKLRGKVCTHCENQDEHKVCRIRDVDDPSHPWCILDTYFTLVVGAIERVTKAHV